MNIQTLQTYLPFASLLVAALAVVVGPLISWHIARRQQETDLRVANKQIIAPIRQAWINSLRDRTAELINTAHWFYIAGKGDALAAEDEEAEIEVGRKMLFLQRQVELMLNPNEEDHKLLAASLSLVVSSVNAHGKGFMDFPDNCENAKTICQKILKREWERVKNDI
jgi:hypothetical protein